MSAQRKTSVAVVFGGRSVEHDVSIVTAHQIMRAFDRNRHDVTPVYIDREGRWFTGEPLLELNAFKNDAQNLAGVVQAVLSPAVQHHGLIVNPTPSGLLAKSAVKRIDVVFPAIHGTHGEDGTLQGLLELADIPYVGCGVLASAIANDKAMTKTLLRAAGIPVVDSVNFTRSEWLTNPEQVIARAGSALKYPLFVKPATLGSSIGIGRAVDEPMLRAYIDLAAGFDEHLLVESAVENAVEINCSVLGMGSAMQASVLEQPLSWQEFLTYEEKYLRGGEGMKSAERIIPAPLTPELTERVQQLALDAFRAIGGRGIARIDFLIQPDAGVVFLNEINTMPGSLSFYLWKETGISQTALVERLVQVARDAYAEKRRNTYNYQTSLVALTAERGLKGMKK
ncbi:MAG: D-alanine--D-alanine ligase [Anaerolineae bacterium]|nr:D-alanine--D-alanine ligase [Anaerolineae bacterium]NUQ02628.1 D-alanine--D-alanine ligase [Anaerolineae bacterium]